MTYKELMAPNGTGLVSSRLNFRAEETLDNNGSDNGVDKEQPRSIRFPMSVWRALDADARRCGRSSLKQMEQLLRMYLKLPYAEIEREAVDSIDLRPTTAPLARVVNLIDEVGEMTPATTEELETAHPKPRRTGARKGRR